MKMQAVRWLLVSAILMTAADGALAGVTTTTMVGTTTTTMGGPTTTTTVGPTTTTTTPPPTTTTTTPPPTTTTTTTTAPPPTTTTTLPPGDLSGDRGFLDTKNSERNQAALNIDLAGDRFCWAGQIEGTDATVTPNRQVLFQYLSNGSVKKANSKKVDGEFDQVDLRLTITALDDAGEVEFDDTITTGCTFKGSLRNRGARSKGKLRCDVGDDFAAFGLNTPENEALLENVENAYPRRNNLKLKTNRGKIKFRHNGDPAPSGFTVEVTCDFPSPTATATP
jgi:hypothetical protein